MSAKTVPRVLALDCSIAAVGFQPSYLKLDCKSVIAIASLVPRPFIQRVYCFQTMAIDDDGVTFYSAVLSMNECQNSTKGSGIGLLDCC